MNDSQAPDLGLDMCTWSLYLGEVGHHGHVEPAQLEHAPRVTWHVGDHLVQVEAERREPREEEHHLPRGNCVRDG